jgi:hypothetical protein
VSDVDRELERLREEIRRGKTLRGRFIRTLRAVVLLRRLLEPRSVQMIRRLSASHATVFKILQSPGVKSAEETWDAYFERELGKRESELAETSRGLLRKLEG